MKSIYETATCTLSWIGPCTQTLAFAIKTINEVHTALQPGERGGLRLLGLS
jgi:hypothetical protein